jgi:hypothetical protein
MTALSLLLTSLRSFMTLFLIDFIVLYFMMLFQCDLIMINNNTGHD